MKSTFLHPLIRILLFIVSASIAQTASAVDTQADWNMAAAIVQAIEPPVIGGDDYLITDFGAASGGRKDARPAILEAINQASAKGGGRVVIPKGTWLSKGPIHLKSHVNLHVAEGVTLLFSADHEDYLPAVFTRWEGTEMYGYSPLIYAHKVTDVAITGTGVIDGNKNSDFHAWHKRQSDDITALRQMGIDGVPLEKRQFHKGHFLRPSMIQFIDAQRVLLQDYTVTNSPFWVNHLVYTDHAIMRGVKVDSMFPNNDGVDVDSSRYVLIENNRFKTGDDAVVVKSGRDYDGRKVARPSENIVVRNNEMAGEDGIALGSEMSGSIRHVFFSDNIYRNGSAAVRFKANLDRGGVVEHVRVRNMDIEKTGRLFWFELTYAAGAMGGNFPSIYRDIVFEDITVGETGLVFKANAPKGYPLQDVTLRNITIKKADELFVIDNVDNLVFDNVQINGQRVNGQLDWK
ncbi:MAG TPA: glycoside hydrolase family 28 protein [Cellvibrio sp.]|nr:glycoside hydrolase family 28 protein [Cellvibrio sp.]